MILSQKNFSFPLCDDYLPRARDLALVHQANRSTLLDLATFGIRDTHVHISVPLYTHAANSNTAWHAVGSSWLFASTS